jgi:hypothetical protein
VQFLTLLFDQNSPRKAERALSAALPGSLAAEYATHRLAVIRTITEAGPLVVDAMLQKGAVTVEKDGTVQSCTSVKGATSTCASFGNPRIVGGKLASFTIDGNSLAGRFADGSKPVAYLLDNWAQLLTAYRSIDGTLSITVRFTAGSAALQPLPAFARYVAPDGRIIAANSSIAPQRDLTAGQSCLIFMAFPTARLGGTVKLTGSGRPTSNATADLRVA